MDKALIVDDEYIKEVGRYSQTRGKELEQLLGNYIKVLEEIKNEAIVEGEISNSLSAYIDCVKLLTERLEIISSNMKTVCNNLVADIDAADSYLF